MMKTSKVKELIRQKFAWPGGYEIYLITSDGAELCCGCARENYRQIAWSIRNKINDGWRVEGFGLDCDTDDRVECAHCGRVIKEAWDGDL